MNDLRPGLPPLPHRIAQLPRDERGYPVPWFVEWIEGKPDFRVVDGRKLRDAIVLKACWICGQPLGVYKSFLIGPMCAVNRTSGEPPSHTDCARFAAITCPFLTHPHAKRREHALPGGRHLVGDGAQAKPGVALVWTTAGFKLIRGVGSESLFRLMPPIPPASKNVEWYCEGRPATRAEVEASVESGYPALLDLAEREGPDAIAELTRMRAEAERLYPA